MLAYCRNRSSGWAWMFLIILCHSQPTWHVNSSRGKENTWKVEASKPGICESLARFFEQLNFAMCNSTQNNVRMRSSCNEVFLLFLNARFAYGTHESRVAAFSKNTAIVDLHMELTAWCVFQERHHRAFAHATHDFSRFPMTPPSWICTWNLQFDACSKNTAIVELHMELTVWCFFQEHRNRIFAHGIHGLMHFPRTPPSKICTWNSRFDAFTKTPP